MPEKIGRAPENWESGAKIRFLCHNRRPAPY
jgi:hypothetical protein